MKKLKLLFTCIVVTGLLIFGSVNVINLIDKKSDAREAKAKAEQVNEKMKTANHEDENVKKAIRTVNTSLSELMSSYKEEEANHFLKINRSQLIKDQKLIADQI